MSARPLLLLARSLGVSHAAVLQSMQGESLARLDHAGLDGPTHQVTPDAVEPRDGHRQARRVQEDESTLGLLRKKPRYIRPPGEDLLAHRQRRVPRSTQARRPLHDVVITALSSSDVDS